jgi:uncharacterized protein (DUF1786 family)
VSSEETGTILAIDIGAGTQDILLFDPERTPENCFRMVMPSQTQVVGARIRTLTERGVAVHLTGTVMGGGASSDAVRAHVAAGLPVSATPSAARTIHNDPERVRSFGISIVDDRPEGATQVELADLDLPGLQRAFSAFEIELPPRFAIAVQDHGVQQGRGNNDVRGEYLHWLVNEAQVLEAAAFTTPPPAMTRMQAVQESADDVVVMDTGAAAVLGALRDQRVAEAAERGVVLVNIGNMHTFAILIKERRVLGVFEHHSSGMSAPLLSRLVSALQRGDLTNQQFRTDFDGHGATISPDYHEFEPFEFVAITGPNRMVARDLGWYQAAPYGDMMLTGSFGLVDGYRAARGAAER